MNIWKTLSHIPQVIKAVQDLAAKIEEVHSDPEIQAVIQADPRLAALSQQISTDVRDIEEAFK